ALEPVDARDPVADRQHGAGLGDVDLAVVLLDLALEDVGDFAGLDVHQFPLDRVSRSCWSCVRRLPSNTTLPTDATTPPISEGSTATSSSTLRPVRAASALWRRSRCASSSGAAAVTRAL